MMVVALRSTARQFLLFVPLFFVAVVELIDGSLSLTPKCVPRSKTGYFLRIISGLS